MIESKRTMIYVFEYTKEAFESKKNLYILLELAKNVSGDEIEIK